MIADPLEGLLDQLCAGDAAAAEQVFVAYEPYLRMVVRRSLPAHLRQKFDSTDVVQSIWADVFDGFRSSGWRFQNTAQLKAFLVKATRNRLIDRVRKYRRAASREQPLAKGYAEPATTAADARPSEVAKAQELWELMNLLCPPAHRELLNLKRHGCSIGEIAERTGMHPSSVRRILYDLARRLAAHNQSRLAAPAMPG
jgi:RNA polymerase sigma-70 factor (ECF subfamily)